MDAPTPDTSFAVILPALCWNRYRADFYAVTDTVSPEGIRFRSATRLSPGEALTCSIRGIGVVEARVLRAGAASFLVRVSAARTRRIAVTRALVDYARRQKPAAQERASPRIVPRRQDVTVTRADGATVPGRLLNVSASGAAIALEQRPAVGEAIMVGDLVATVVRRFDDGVGAAFATPLDETAVTEAMSLHRPALASGAPRV